MQNLSSKVESNPTRRLWPAVPATYYSGGTRNPVAVVGLTARGNAVVIDKDGDFLIVDADRVRLVALPDNVADALEAARQAVQP